MKIAVIGCSGAGKSTLAKTLGARYPDTAVALKGQRELDAFLASIGSSQFFCGKNANFS